MTKSEEEGESEEVQINFRASRKQKQEWKAYAEEAGHKSFSDFLRVTVEKEINQESGKRHRTPETSGVSTTRMSELMQKTQAVNSQLDALTDDVKIIKNEVTDDEDLRDLKNEVFSHLPEDEDDFTDIELSVGGEMDSIGATVPGLSKGLNVDENRIDEALSSLMETNLVHSTQIGGETHYYKEV